MAKRKSDLQEEPLKEELPASVINQLGGVMAADEEIQLAVSSDIRLDGRYGDAWVLATTGQLIAFSPNGGDPDIVHLPLAEVDAVEVSELIGLGVLKARTQERGAVLAQFSKTLIPKFSPIARQIETLVQGARPAEQDESIVQGPGLRTGRSKRCKQCGNVIPRWAGVCPACLETRKVLLRLLSYAKPHWHLVALSLTMMVVATTLSLSPPLLMATLVDDVLNTTEVLGAATAAETGAQEAREPTRLGQLLTGWGLDSQGMLMAMVVLLFVIHVSRNGLGALRGYLLSYLGQRITFGLRNQVYRHLNLLSMRFYNERETGRIMASVTQDVGRLQDFISDGLQEAIRDVLIIVVICVILFSLNPGLAALVLLPTPLLVVTTLYFGKRLHRIYRGLWRRWAGISALLADTIPGVRVVKAFAQEQREVGKFEKRSIDLLSGELRVARLRSWFSPSMAFITSLGTMLVWWVGGNKVLGQELSLGDFFAFTSYLWQFYGPVESLCRLNHRFQRAATSAERVFETLDAQPDVADRAGAGVMPRIEGRVEFSQVSFSYEEGKPALDKVDLIVEPGEMIGLAGHSGAGKSTLINLITRFYEAEEGVIRIDGHDIREVQLKSLREQIGVVLQDPFLFSGTVGDNIAYGKPEARLDEVVAAAKAAHAHEFVMNLADGYDTQVGERGTRLSGGERQRLSIARAILRDPRILILDEATSSVDTETEVKIQEALARLIKGRTTFAIAHRLSTLRHANRLLILDKGKIAEVGTHDELIEKDGIYARLCRLQTEMSQLKAW